MGCDIHMTVERKLDDGNWHCVWDGQLVPSLDNYDTDGWRGTAVRERNYAFFAALAGVRGEGPDPKGTPDDASYLTRKYIESWGQDGHSHSWDTLYDFCKKWVYPNDEAGNLKLSTDTLNNCVSKEITRVVDKLFGVYVEGIHNYRVVYWFDN